MANFQKLSKLCCEWGNGNRAIPLSEIRAKVQIRKFTCKLSAILLAYNVNKWKTILSKGLPVLYPLIPLTKIPQGEERRALQEAIHCIEELPEQKVQGELAAAFFLR